ncbi:MAG: formate dehydrogenase accessory sulfurtransferase FdhD [Ignisphaera sp.]
MVHEVSVNVDVKRIDLDKNIVVDIIDEIANEVIVNIYIQGRLAVSIPTSPYMFLELGLGYALTHGLYVDETRIIVKNLDIMLNGVLKKVMICKDNKNVNKIDAQSVYRLFKEVMNKANLFKRTGCFHVAAIASLDGYILDLVEDISRHCALYKVVGKVFQRGIDFSKSIVIMSSRAASELIEGIANICIPIAVFRGAPTERAIEIAKRNGITLIAHVRENKMNVYTGFERILLEKT